MVAKFQTSVITDGNVFACLYNPMAYDSRLTASWHDPVQVAWPSRASRVFLAGGQHYRRVMRAAIGVVGKPELPVDEVHGGIGYQRSQLADFLEGQAPTLADQIGCHPNGQPLYRRFGTFAVGDHILFNEPGPGRHALKRAVLNELFVGPAGPTACADVDDIVAGRPRVVSRWISLAGVRSRAAGAVGLPPAFASNNRIEDAVGVVGGRNIQYINSYGYPLAP
ncbi:MAG: hypothetical protein CL858_04985 [Cupriavidus sp.]|nr:hypothetical protein [Cupriavidus sp.]